MVPNALPVLEAGDVNARVWIRIREVEQGPRGEIYLLEDGGRLLRLEPVRR